MFEQDVKRREQSNLQYQHRGCKLRRLTYRVADLTFQTPSQSDNTQAGSAIADPFLWPDQLRDSIYTPTRPSTKTDPTQVLAQTHHSAN